MSNQIGYLYNQNKVTNIEKNILQGSLGIIEGEKELGFGFNKNAYFLCHGGLGDLFFMCGAIRYLSLFYNTIFLFCPKSALKNLQILYSDINVQFITYDKWYEQQNTNNDWPKVSEDWYKTAAPYVYCINNQYELFDWKKYIKIYIDLYEISNKIDAWHHWINHGKYEGRTFFIKELEELFDWQKYVNINEDLYSINKKQDAWDHWSKISKNKDIEFCRIELDLDADFFVAAKTFNKNFNGYVSKEIITKYKVSSFHNKITNQKFLNFNNNNINNNYVKPYYYNIQDFYSEINMNLSIYYDYFYIPSTLQSWELYKHIKDYKLVFLHFASSCGNSYIPENEWKHIYNDEYLIINPDKNHYDPTISVSKYDLANQYLNLLSVDYIDIILNASDIYVCDSSFASMIFPLRITNRLQAENMIIYDRYYPNKPYNIPKPIHLPKNK
jgi:hypothetical protein